MRDLPKEGTVKVKGQSVMPYLLRPMRWEDLDQVAEIEREAFPTLWPPTSYKREMRNHLAHYVVCVRRGERAPLPVRPPERRGILGHLLQKALGNDSPPALVEPPELVVAFVGLWLMAQDAHIVSIAVREMYRGLGLGELLLLGAVELALQKKQQLVTLEVRVSNALAQNLYQKYGFREVGLRKRYYSDNHENAVIMSTSPITSQEYQQRLAELRSTFEERHGEVERAYA